MKSTVRNGIGAGLALAGALAGSLHADGTNTATKEIVVTATREARESWEVPANVTVIDAAQIRQSAALNVPDALEKLGGVQVRSIAGPANAEVSLRGFGQNSHGRVLVLLDGRRLNAPSMANVNWLQIPVGSVERIEVLRGSSSALYGDYAVAGVINIITRKGSRAPEADVAVEMGSFGMDSESVSASGPMGPVSVSAQAAHYESDGERDRTAYVSQGGGASLQYDISPGLTASAGASLQHVEYEIPGWLSLQEMRDDPTQSTATDDRAENDYLTLHAGVSAESGPHRFALKAAFNTKDMVSDVASWMSFIDETVDTLSVLPTYSYAADVAGRKNHLLIGADYYRDTLSVDRFTDVSRTVMSGTADVTRDTLGGYVRDELNLTDSLIAAAGARVETAEFDATSESSGMPGLDNTMSFDETAVEGSLIRQFANQSKVFLRAGTVYRYPFVDELIIYSGYGPDQFYTDLTPEEGWNVDAGTEVGLGGGTRLGLTVFLLNMKDEIAFDYETLSNLNLDRTRHQGLEASLGVAPVDAVHVGLSYTYTDARFVSGAYDGNDIPLVPAHKASASLRVQLPGDLALDSTATYTGKSYLGGDETNLGPMLDAYTVADVYLRYAPRAVAGLEAFVGADNVFDEQYASLGYRGMGEDGYYPAPGRSFRGGVRYRF